MYISTNLNSINAHRNSKINSDQRAKAMEKLSTGYRINRAADDAAGLAISENMRYQINGFNQASRNIQDGISLIQTAEGATQEIHAMLQRMNVLANQSASGTYSDSDRAKIDLEFQQLKREINSIAENTNFNGINVLNGNRQLTATDTINWEKVNSGSDKHFYNIAWSGTQYLAVGFAGNTLASYDGTTWFEPHSPVTSVNLHSVKWDGSQFLITEGGKIYTTTDGVNRSGYSYSFPPHFDRLFMADYVGGKYIAVGENGAIATTTNPNVANSWVAQNSNTSEMLMDVASNGSEYIAVGKNGVILKSSDAITWSEQTSGVSDDLRQVVWANNQYVAVGSGTVLTSDDGQNWVKQQIPIAGFAPNNLLYDGENYHMVAGSTVLSSTDAVNWEVSKIGSGSQTQAIVFNGKEYIAVGMFGNIYKGTKDAMVSQGIAIQKGVEAENYLEIVVPDVRVSVLGISDANLISNNTSKTALVSINNAINLISSERSRMGAYQNRLEHTLNNVLTSAENLSAAHSRITDTDMALEMTHLTKSQILSEAGQAMIAQANTSPQNILKMLNA